MHSQRSTKMKDNLPIRLRIYGDALRILRVFSGKRRIWVCDTFIVRQYAFWCRLSTVVVQRFCKP
jgi:hypothetical protein